MQYRYLDLRRPRLQETIRLRSHVAMLTRRILADEFGVCVCVCACVYVRVCVILRFAPQISLSHSQALLRLRRPRSSSAHQVTFSTDAMM